MTYRPIKHHGIRLAAGSFLHNAAIENLPADPALIELTPGRIWFNTAEKALKFTEQATNGDVAVRTATSQADIVALLSLIGTLANLATTDKSSLVAGVNEVVGKVGTLANLNTTVKTDLVAALNEVKGTVNSIGNAFNYVNLVAGGADELTALDLTTLTEKDTGDYYKVSTAGWFAVGLNAPFQANVGDGLVWNLSGTVDIIDNTNANIAGTADQIDVVGSPDTGFTAKFSTTFTDIVDDLVLVQGNMVVGTGLGELGGYTAPPTANYLFGTTSLLGAILALDAALLQTEDELGRVKDGAGLDGNGNYVADEYGNFIQAATSLHNATQRLDTALKAEVERAVSVEGSLANISAHYLATYDDSTPVESLAEAIIRTDTKAKLGYTDALNQLIDTQNAINSSYVTFISTAAASSFEITHNFGTDLGAEFITVDVWVKDVNGGFTRYYNDIVSIEETTADVVTITATSDIEIKAVLHAVITIDTGV